MKTKESGKSDKYTDIARELKTLWGMRVTLLSIIIGAFGTVPKGLERGLEEPEIRGGIETM